MKKILIFIFLNCSHFLVGQVKDNQLDLAKHKVEEFENVSDTLNDNYFIALNNLGHLLEDSGDTLESKKIYLKTLKSRIAKFGENHQDVAKSLIHLSDLYYAMGNYLKAEPYCINAVQIRKKLFGENNLEYSKSLSKLGLIYFKLKKYKDAEEVFLIGLNVKRENLEDTDPSYFISLNYLSSLYDEQGRYFDLEKILLQKIQILKKTKGISDSEYLTSLAKLGICYYYQGKYLDAEISYLNVIGIGKSLIESKPQIAELLISSLNNLAEFYRTQKSYTKSKEIFEEALEINKAYFNNNIDEQIVLKHNLALLSNDLKDFDRTMDLLVETAELIKSKGGEEGLMYANVIGNMATFCANPEVYELDIILPLINGSIRRKKNILGFYHPLYLESLIKLADIYELYQKYGLEEIELLNALEICEKVYGKTNQNYLNILIRLAENYRHQNSKIKASNYFNQFLIYNKERLTEISSSYTERELTNYVFENKISFNKVLSFVNELDFDNSSIITNCFENLLILKNISLINQEKFLKAIVQSNNNSLMEKYKKFVSIHSLLLKYNELPLNKKPENLEKIKIEKSSLEKELINESISFREFRNNSKNINDLIGKLQPGEIIIDLNSYDYHIDSKNDSLVYFAFVLSGSSNEVKTIKLFSEYKLLSLLMKNTSLNELNRIDNQYNNQEIIKLFTGPIINELKDIHTIYFSLTGLAYKLNFSALPINSFQTLGEKFKVHIMNTPLEYLERGDSQKRKDNLELLLFGGIDYDKSKVLNDADYSDGRNKDKFNELSLRNGVSKFSYLSGTQKEVENIHKKSKLYKINSSIINGQLASEERFKQLDGRKSPYILHLATHGFFIPDTVNYNLKSSNLNEKFSLISSHGDPMMRSGLIFSGANRNLEKVQNDFSEDGILTASEISYLDLSACQLVVLSACETGLGELNGTEGVFGLQRAFKMAGVKNIIMSLWKVPDAQTSELFEHFYTEFLSGKTIHNSFQTAQSIMKNKYSPYYWAGFILLE